MLRWVVTGPMGAGKSLATQVLAEHGAAVVDGDRLGHEVLTLPRVVREVTAAFGAEVAPGGVVDRTRLGPIVFADPRAMARLNAITHALISELASRRLDDLARSAEWELAVLDAAMYFLFPSPPPVDRIIAVTAGESVRMDRLVRSRGMDPAEAARRVAAQRDMEPLWSRADILLPNEGDIGRFRQQVAELYHRALDY